MMDSEVVDLLDYLTSVETTVVAKYFTMDTLSIKEILSPNNKLDSRYLTLKEVELRSELNKEYFLMLSESFKEDYDLLVSNWNPWIYTTIKLEPRIVSYNGVMYLTSTIQKYNWNLKKRLFILTLKSL